MKRLIISLVLTACLIHAFSGCDLMSCILNEPAKPVKTVSVATWNVQTFFDAESDGNEYAEFVSAKSKWTSEKYQKRVERLCEIISLLDADVVALEEVEKESLAYDIANHLDLQANRKKFYPYSCFACEENGVFGNLVISRYPLKNMTVHNIDVRDEKISDIPKLRPLLEVDVMSSEADNAVKAFKLFVCHWKSKAQDADASGVWRNYQQSLLAERLTKCTDENYVVCGDFNQDLSEFEYEARDLQTEVILKGIDKNFRVKSAWNIDDKGGSYFYDGNWEKIDHFFVGKELNIENFCSLNNGPHVKTDGTPNRYAVYSGEGYSDHLPLRIFIKKTEK